MWLKDNIQRIISFVKSVFSSISNIASGNIGGAASFIEGAIAKTIPMILSGLAQFLHLGGIAKKIQNVIKKIRKPIDNAINKGIKVISKRVKGWFGGREKKKGDGKKIKDKSSKKENDKKKESKDLKDNVVKWSSKDVPFTSVDGGRHHIKFKLKGAKVNVIVHSKPLPIEILINREIKEANKAGNKQAESKAKAALAFYRSDVLQEIDEIEKLEIKRDSLNGNKRIEITKKIKSKEIALRFPLQVLGQKLSVLNLDEESGQAVPSELKPIRNGGEANPLTFLSGNTKGSKPSIDIPGWEHAKKLNVGYNDWVRGHLLSERLHGPGNANWNLVVIDKSSNKQMLSSVEEPAIAKAKALWKSESENDKNKVLYYRTTFTKHSDNPPVSDFGMNIKVEWGEQKLVPGKPGQFTDQNELGSRTFISHKPPEKADDIVYNINSMGEPTLIKKFGFKTSFARTLAKVITDKDTFSNYDQIDDAVLDYYEKNTPNTRIVYGQLDKLRELINSKQILF